MNKFNEISDGVKTPPEVSFLYPQIRDLAQAYTALGKVGADNESNKAKLDYSHDSV